MANTHSDRKMNKVTAYKKRGIFGIVFLGIWLVIAITCLVLGLVLFFHYLETYQFFAWLIAGAICCVPIIGIIISMVKDGADQGAREGANTYTSNVSSTHSSITVTTQNHPFIGMAMGVVVGLILSAAFGPVLLALVILLKIVHFIRNIVDYVKDHKSHNSSTPKIDKKNNVPVNVNNSPRPVKNQVNIVIPPVVDIEFNKDFSIKKKSLLVDKVGTTSSSSEILKIDHYEVYKSKEEDSLLLRLDLINLSEAKINNIKFDIKLKDYQDKDIGVIKDIDVTLDPVNKDESFFADHAISLPKEVGSGEIIITRLGYVGGLHYDEPISINFETNGKLNYIVNQYILLHQGGK